MCSQPEPSGAHPSTAVKSTPSVCAAQLNLGIAENLKNFFLKSAIQVLGWRTLLRILVGIALQAWRSRLEAADLDPQGPCVLSTTRKAWFYIIPSASRGFGACFIYNLNLGGASHFCNADNTHRFFHCLYHQNHWQNSMIKFVVPPLFCTVCC